MKVMGSNPSTVYLIVSLFVEKTKINEKRGRGWPI